LKNLRPSVYERKGNFCKSLCGVGIYFILDLNFYILI